MDRHYDGQHVGPSRFDIIVDAMKSAVNYKPFNRVSNEFQFGWKTQTRGRGGRGWFTPRGTEIPHVDELDTDGTVSQESEIEDDSEVLFKTQKECKVIDSSMDNWGKGNEYVVGTIPANPNNVQSQQVQEADDWSVTDVQSQQIGAIGGEEGCWGAEPPLTNTAVVIIIRHYLAKPHEQVLGPLFMFPY